MTAYKLFKLRKDGTISSLFINNKEILPFGKWLKAEEYPTYGFAFRPGWHSTHAPYAPHLSLKNRIWFKVEIKDFSKIERPDSQGGVWYLSKWIKIGEII